MRRKNLSLTLQPCRALGVIKNFAFIRLPSMQRCAFLRLLSAFLPKSGSRLVDQMRRSSRSVCSNIGEAWRKRRYPANFVSKLSDSESEAEETRVWLELAFRCGYISKGELDELDKAYGNIIGQLVRMIEHPEQWTIKTSKVQVKHANA